ncbi:hypothetical protein B9Z19DRAFT_1129383 [Tuber borchii]|uniref:Uncharacterized protein n=1 Tax=Tuber borchii TaxID=42251 RepID=A0A2T6ZMI2_TUBBO|nr:hypothetical protein B9Z19DRAFT_1129383 [Tuber borchii]
MSPTAEFVIRAMLPQFDKQDSSESQGHNSNGMSLGEILAIVIAALTLVVAMIPLFRCSQFRHYVPSTVSHFFRKTLRITLPDPVPIAVTTTEDSSATPAPEIPIPRSIFIYNHYSNAHLVGTCSNAFLHSQNGTVGEDGRVLQVGESLPPRRPERAVTYPLL